ncbi:MAG: hydrogenase expression/formation protein HypE [Selenomonadaceae bacterium]|nr:hydrogenase expression/formation protein HypE [Selenomonadaceae bacterium]
MSKKILMAHGAGGKLSAQLLREIILPAFDNEILNELHDGAKIGRLAMTTDSYVVRPIFFRGGDIGKLSICGTVNDLAVTGAVPKYISVGVILEEGFDFDALKKIVGSMASAAREAGVKIVTGDTKVVGRGQADGIFINTAGVGELIDGVDISAKKICAGMKILISGTIGDHATTILAARHGLELPENIQSDCAPLNKMIHEMLSVEPKIAMLRDATRGGVAAVLNEIAQAANVGILIDEEKIPVREEVRGVCDILGFDALELANEGKIIAVVPAQSSEKILSVMRKNIYGTNAAQIGEVVKSSAGKVGLKTSLGAVRIVDMPTGELVPRIC